MRGVPKWSTVAKGPVVGSVSNAGKNALRILQFPSKLTAAMTHPEGSNSELRIDDSNLHLIFLLVQLTPLIPSI